MTPQAEALALYRTGKFDEAAEAYEKLTASDPATAYAGLARVYLRQKKVAEAYAAAKKGTETAANSSDARLALGEVYFRQGKIADAEREFVAVANSGQGSARAYLDLSRVDKVSSFYATSKTMIEMAHRIDPADPDVRREWLTTLPLEDRLKELKAYLAGETNDDDNDRSRLAGLLASLEQESGQPLHACRQANKISSTHTPLIQLLHDPRHIRGYGLTVNLNGANAKLLLDTGAGGILIDRKIAEKAGIKSIGHTEIAGIGNKGGASGYIGYADSIKVGDLEFHDCRVEVVDRRSVLDDDGLIGADVFQHYLIDINLPDGKFSLSELPNPPQQEAEPGALEAGHTGSNIWHNPYVAPEMKSYSPVFRFGHMLLIPTRLNDSPPVLFLIDTGAFNNSISPEAARQVSKVHSTDDLKVKGLSGNVANVYYADNVTLQFAHFRQENQDLVSFDLSGVSNSAGTEISGTLGFPLLYMLDVKIDYRDGLVNFTFDKNRFH